MNEVKYVTLQAIYWILESVRKKVDKMLFVSHFDNSVSAFSWQLLLH